MNRKGIICGTLCTRFHLQYNLAHGCRKRKEVIQIDTQKHVAIPRYIEVIAPFM